MGEQMAEAGGHEKLVLDMGGARRRWAGIECVWRLAGACHAVMANSRALLQVCRHMGRQAGGHVHVVWGRVYMRGCIGV